MAECAVLGHVCCTPALQVLDDEKNARAETEAKEGQEAKELAVENEQNRELSEWPMK